MSALEGFLQHFTLLTRKKKWPAILSVFTIQLFGPVPFYGPGPMAMRLRLIAIFLVLGQAEVSLPQLHQEAALVHLAAPPVQNFHRVVVLPRRRSAEERLGVHAHPAGRVHEPDARRGLEMGEVPHDGAHRLRHVLVRVFVLDPLGHRVMELVALAFVVAVVAVHRYGVVDLLADGYRRLRVSIENSNSKSVICTFKLASI